MAIYSSVTLSALLYLSLHMHIHTPYVGDFQVLGLLVKKSKIGLSIVALRRWSQVDL